ncbi:MAG: type IX secretion system membrane protein PorP/SprF [Bacteroidota bacterium]
MIKRLLKSLLPLYCVFLASYSFGQDPEFSQYYANPLYLNPAYAGSNICPRLIMNYRNQWPAISGTYVTYNASYDQHFDGISGGLGLLVYNDKAGEGTLNTTQISLIYSYKFDVSRKFSIRTGLQASYFQRRIDWDKLTFGDMIDRKLGFINQTQEVRPSSQTISTPDFSAGIVGYSQDFWAGFAAHHITQPNEGFLSYARLPMKITGHIGGFIPLNGRIGKRRRKLEDPTISPNILFNKQQDFTQLNYGFYFNKYPFVTGIWYRQSFENSDALIVLVGFQQSAFKFGYSYDVTVSKLSSSTAGAHELSFTLNFPCRPKRKRLRAIQCPSF